MFLYPYPQISLSQGNTQCIFFWTFSVHLKVVTFLTYNLRFFSGREIPVHIFMAFKINLDKDSSPFVVLCNFV